jgi:mRNA interferase MazF
MKTPKRYEVWLANLDPTVGSEVKKTRPCIVVSPDEMNKWVKTIIIVPLTSSSKEYVSRVSLEFRGVKGQAMIDQIRTIDKSRLIKKIGQLSSTTANRVSNSLLELFS